MINALPDGSRVIVSLATGLGKTVIAAHIARKGRMLILSHRDELVRQPEKYFPASVSYGVEKGKEYSHGEDIVSASVQTLSSDRRLHRFDPKTFDVVVVDEAHHSAAPTYRKVINYFKPRLLIGLTATPKRGDGVRLDDIYNSIVFQRSMLWGIRNNYLSNIKAIAIHPSLDISDVEMQMGDYAQKSLAAVIDVDIMYDTIADAYVTYGYQKRQTVIYCLSIEGCNGAAKAIRKRIPRSDWKTMKVISGKTPLEERQQMEADFMDGKLNCLLNCMVLTEGTDLPCISLIIINRPSTNDSLYTQIVGRGVRKYKRKKQCLVLDIMPKSEHRICNAVNLAGIEWEDLSEEQKQRADEEGLDILALADELESAKARFMGIYTEEIDLFEYYLENENKLIYSNLESSPYNLVHAITDDRRERILRAREEDGSYDFLGMRYTIGRGEDARYVIQGDTNNYEFHLSRPDMLGQTSISAQIDGREYVSEAMKMEDAITAIKKILVQNCQSTKYMWDAYTEACWRDVPATKKQMYRLSFAIKDIARLGPTPADVDETLEALSKAETVNKYQASVAIDYLNSHIDNVRKLQNLKNEFADKQKKRIHTVPDDKADYSFEEYADPFMSCVLPPVRTYVPVQSGYISIPVKNLISRQAGQPPSQKQIQFIGKLITGIKSRGGQFDAQARTIRLSTSNDASCMIEVLLGIANSDQIHLHRNPVIWISRTAFMVDENQNPFAQVYLQYATVEPVNVEANSESQEG